MNIKYENNLFFLEFEDIQENLFFFNLIEYGISLLKNTEVEKVSKLMDSIVRDILRYHKKDKLLRKVSEVEYKINKEYLYIVLENIETFFRIETKDNTSLKEEILGDFNILKEIIPELLKALRKEENL